MPARTRRTSLAGQRSGSVEQFTTDADQDVRNTKHMEALLWIDKPVAETVPGAWTCRLTRRMPRTTCCPIHQERQEEASCE